MNEMNHTIYEHFSELLTKENKESCVQFALDQLHQGRIGLVDLYQELLTPALNEFSCPVDDNEVCIWKEHARTAIIRTIVEATYLDLMKEKRNTTKHNKSVIVVCPSEEYHEVGALIVANLFELAGFDARYIGANTPKNDILSAIKVLQPDYIAISVTNYYNIVQTKQITQEIRQRYPLVKIIVGGAAFGHPSSAAAVYYDFHLNSFQDIASLAEEVKQ
jgi:MerR family transcriptional regulator, light-induced transcriptional regulator